MCFQSFWYVNFLGSIVYVACLRAATKMAKICLCCKIAGLVGDSDNFLVLVSVTPKGLPVVYWSFFFGIWSCLWVTLEKAMAPHSSTLAWKIPWMGEPGGLQSTGSWRVRDDWATSLALFTFMHWRRNGNPLQCSCLENPRDRGAWWAAVYGVAQSRTWLKRLSNSSRSTHSRILSWRIPWTV